MLEVKDAFVKYGAIIAVRNVSFSVTSGEIVALIGPNGAGKTSILRAISGLTPLSSGSISFEGNELDGVAAFERARLGIGQVPEGRHLFGPLSVEDNLIIGGQRLNGYDKKRGLEYIFTLFPRLQERRELLAHSLSGGEQQMLAIGRALIGRPKILVLDEPSMGLAPQIVDLIFDTLGALKEEGQTILLVEQDAELALSFSQRAMVMNVGEIVLSGDSSDLKEKQDLMDSYLGSAR